MAYTGSYAEKKFDIPEIPESVLTSLEGYHAQTAITGLWETYHKTPEYATPGYQEHLRTSGEEPFYTGWGTGAEYPERHMADVFGWSESDIGKVIDPWFGGDGNDGGGGGGTGTGIWETFGGKYPISDVTAAEGGYSTIELARELAGMSGYESESPEWQAEMERYLPWLAPGEDTPSYGDPVITEVPPPEEPFGPISSCFLPETLLLTKDGQKSIKDVKIKDKILTENGAMVQVVKKFVHEATNYLVINDSLRVTSSHPILVNDRWVVIGKANVGDKLFGIDGKEVIIDSIKPINARVTVYNLEVKSPHTFFADGILVHNKMYPSPDAPTGEPGYGDPVVTQVPGEPSSPYYTPDDWEYTQRWGANPPPSPEWEALEKGEPYTFQPFEPKTQPPTGVGFEPSQYEAGGVPEYLQKWLTELEQPIEADIGLTERERQSIYNLGRGQIQGATRTAAEQMRETLGGRGFRAGETGFADVPIQQIYQGGQRQLGEFGKEIAISEADRRFQQQVATRQLELQRLGMGSQVAAQIASMEAQERTAGRQLTSQERMFGTQLEWEQSRQAQEFQWQQEMFGEQQRWEQERFGRELSQEERLAQQRIEWEQQQFGQEMEWDKYRFEEQFGYQQERDVMNDLFSYLGLGIQSQQARYEPYWQSWMGVI